VFGLTTTDKERFHKPMTKAINGAADAPNRDKSVTRTEAAVEAYEKKVGTWYKKLKEGEDFTSHAVSFAWRNLDGSPSEEGVQSRKGKQLYLFDSGKKKARVLGSNDSDFQFVKIVDCVSCIDQYFNFAIAV
jgi:hypothetical protein